MQAKCISLRGAAHIYGFSVDSLCRRFSEGVLPAVKTVLQAHPRPHGRPRPGIPADANEYRYRW
jgi:hypothetical protein